MENLFEGGVAELETIKEAIIEENRKALELDQAKDNLTAKEKEIDAENKDIEDKIQEVLKAKRGAVYQSFEEDVNKADAVLKESIRQRNAAKEVAVNKRISQETAGIQEESNQLAFSLKTFFRNANLPAFCSKPYYYALFAPRTAKDFLAIIITAIIAFAAIPIAVISLIDTTTVGKVFIYIGIVVFFCLIYLAVFFWTQPNRNRKILEMARPDIEKLQANKKEMKKMTRNIRNDQDESQYGLEELDSEIVRNRGIYDDAVARREEALRAFEAEMEPAVRDEVTGARAETMNRLHAERDYLQMEYDRKEQEKTMLDRRIQQNYSTYIGKKNMHPEKLDQLITIIEDGKAGNILEALDVQKESSKITNRIAEAADRIIPDEDATKDLVVPVEQPKGQMMAEAEMLPADLEEMSAGSETLQAEALQAEAEALQAEAEEEEMWIG